MLAPQQIDELLDRSTAVPDGKNPAHSDMVPGLLQISAPSMTSRPNRNSDFRRNAIAICKSQTAADG